MPSGQPLGLHHGQGSDDADNDEQCTFVRRHFPSFDHGSDILHHLMVQKTPKVSDRQRVDANKSMTRMTKTVLTRTLTPVKTITATTMNGIINPVFAIGHQSTCIDA